MGGIKCQSPMTVNAHLLSPGSRCAQRPGTRLECLAAWKRALLQQTVLVFDSDPQDALEGSCHIPPAVCKQRFGSSRVSAASERQELLHLSALLFSLHYRSRAHCGTSPLRFGCSTPGDRRAQPAVAVSPSRSPGVPVMFLNVERQIRF